LGTLGRENAGLLACSGAYALRHRFPRGCPHQQKEDAGNEIFNNRLDSLRPSYLMLQIMRAKIRQLSLISKVFHICCGKPQDA
jgi:hypothetical protein